MKSFDLRPVRITDLIMVPRALVEKVPHAYWETDDLYGLSEHIFTKPDQFLFAFVDPEHAVKGFMWVTLSVLGRRFWVNAVVLDSEYQRRGLLKRLIIPLLNSLKEKYSVEKLNFLTDRPKAYQKFGYAETGVVVMEG